MVTKYFFISTISEAEFFQDWLIELASETINTWVLFISYEDTQFSRIKNEKKRNKTKEDFFSMAHFDTKNQINQ